MSADISKTRQDLSQALSFVKQGKAAAAVQGIHAGLSLLLGTPLMKSERNEFEELINNALFAIQVDSVVKKFFPQALNFKLGQERELLEQVKMIADGLGEYALQQADEAKKAKEEKKRATLARALAELETTPSKGLATLAALKRSYPSDPDLLGEIGEVLLRAKMYEEAVSYLSEALDMKPDMLPHYNTIGMALRKLERFDVAETYYLRASAYLRTDPNLYFNIGRLYLDWNKLEKAKQAALVALKLNPDFVEANKLLIFVEKKLAKSAS